MYLEGFWSVKYEKNRDTDRSSCVGLALLIQLINVLTESRKVGDHKLFSECLCDEDNVVCNTPEKHDYQK